MARGCTLAGPVIAPPASPRPRHPLGLPAGTCYGPLRLRTENPMSESMPAPQATGQPTQPLVVNIQYVKDLSFEVPGAPQIFTQLRSQPQVNINLDVQARRLEEGPNLFEVMLVIRAEAHEAAPQG